MELKKEIKGLMNNYTHKKNLEDLIKLHIPKMKNTIDNNRRELDLFRSHATILNAVRDDEHKIMLGASYENLKIAYEAYNQSSALARRLRKSKNKKSKNRRSKNRRSKNRRTKNRRTKNKRH